MVTANKDQDYAIGEIPTCPKCASAYCPGARGDGCRTLPDVGDACERCASASCQAAGGPICRTTGLLRSFTPREPESKDAKALEELAGKVNAVEARILVWRNQITAALAPKGETPATGGRGRGGK